MGSGFFVYLSVVEGFMIVCMLGWEIFWLRRMYIVLQSMPTAEQLTNMLNMIKDDRDAIRNGLSNITSTFSPALAMFSGLIGGSKKIDN